MELGSEASRRELVYRRCRTIHADTKPSVQHLIHLEMQMTCGDFVLGNFVGGDFVRGDFVRGDFVRG